MGGVDKGWWVGGWVGRGGLVGCGGLLMPFRRREHFFTERTGSTFVAPPQAAVREGRYSVTASSSSGRRLWRRTKVAGRSGVKKKM